MRVGLVQPELEHDASAANLECIAGELRARSYQFAPDDVLVLPERFELRDDRGAYEREVCELARELGCHVVGGSQRERTNDRAVNSGIVADPAGGLLGSYDKLRPYGVERQWLEPGTRLGEFTIAGRRLLVLVCADFWFVDLILGATAAPDVIVVPALSVTRQATPDYARALWRHLAVSRAYEFGAYVAISDWAHGSRLPVLQTAGVAGLADPTTKDPARLFQPLTAPSARFELDFERLAAFRADRRARGFYWRTKSETPL